MHSNVAILMLTLPLADIRKIKRTIRTLGSLGVTSFDSIIEEMVIGCARRKDKLRCQVETEHRARWGS